MLVFPGIMSNFSKNTTWYKNCINLSFLLDYHLRYRFRFDLSYMAEGHPCALHDLNCFVLASKVLVSSYIEQKRRKKKIVCQEETNCCYYRSKVNCDNRVPPLLNCSNITESLRRPSLAFTLLLAIWHFSIFSEI